MTGVTVNFAREKQRLISLRDQLQYLTSHQGRVGWVDPTKMHPVEEGQKAPASMATIARTLNYGREAGVRSDGKPYPAIPARPFMNMAFDQHLSSLKEKVNFLFGGVIKGRIDGKQLIDGACLFWKSKLQQTMRESSNFQPLSSFTVKGRKSRNKTLRPKRANTPLIDTGALIQAIDHEVVSL